MLTYYPECSSEPTGGTIPRSSNVSLRHGHSKANVGKESINTPLTTGFCEGRWGSLYYVTLKNSNMYIIRNPFLQLMPFNSLISERFLGQGVVEERGLGEIT